MDSDRAATQTTVTGPQSRQPMSEIAVVPEPIRLTGGYVLRVLDESDLDELHRLIEANRGYLARWLPWAAAQTRDDTAEFLRRKHGQIGEGNGFEAAICDGDRIIGVIGFHAVDWWHRSTSIGYWLAEPAQGRGTMTEAVGAMLDQAFRVWDLNRVEIRAATDNRRSRALIERVGFQCEGTARQAFRLADGYRDDAVYAMLAADWVPLNG
jgi:ribosomal-protein-serine acetyltransferase